MSVTHSLLVGVLDEAALARLFDRAKCVKWGLPREAFADALGRSVASRFGNSGANVGEIEAYLDTVYLEDLALACACAEGQVTAWAYFVECFRPALRTAARSIAGDSAASDLADGIAADLYGFDERDGRRRSLFDYFHGRSRLATWLRAILARRHVDRLGRIQPFEPLADGEETPASPSTNEVVAVDRLGLARLTRTTADDCPPVEVLSAWFDHALTASEAAPIEAHVASCGRCGELVGHLARTEPEILYVHPKPEPVRWTWHLRWAAPLAGAAVLGFVVGTRSLLAPDTGAQAPRPTASPEKAAEAIAHRPDALGEQPASTAAGLSAFVPGSEVGWRHAQRGVVLRTVDGGANWTEQSLPGDPRLLALSPVSPSICWAAGAAGVIVRTVDGTTWQVIAGPTREDLTAIAALDERRATLRTASGVTFDTGDAGATWRQR